MAGFIDKFNLLQSEMLKARGPGVLCDFDFGTVVNEIDNLGYVMVQFSVGPAVACLTVQSCQQQLEVGSKVFAVRDSAYTTGVIIGLLYPLELPQSEELTDPDTFDFTAPRIASDIYDATIGSP